jgi:hypothetical protein
MTDVTTVLSQLKAGTITTDQAAGAFTDMDWPTAPPTPRTLTEIEADPDGAGDRPGDFAEVEQAYVEGDITLEQYEKLAAATMGTNG